MRTLAELSDVDDPAWPLIDASIREATSPVVVLPVDPLRGGRTLVDLQVTARSWLGALALHSGGLLIDHGWLRILGGGVPLLNLADANGLPDPSGIPPRRLVVAFDVLGGTFAVNGGGLPGEPGEVCYFAPDELSWYPMGIGHAAFVEWSMTGGLADFNGHLRWPGWEDEVSRLSVEEGIAVYPFPFTAEGNDLSQVSRRRAPMGELLTLWESLARQVHDTAD